MISLETLQILTPLQKLPKNVGDFGKLIFTLVNLVTLLVTANFDPIFEAYNSSVEGDEGSSLRPTVKQIWLLSFI